MSSLRQVVTAFRGPVLLVLLFVYCTASPSGLEKQIAGEGCYYEAEYSFSGKVQSLDDPEVPYRCVSRATSLWNWLSPQLEARCQEDAARCAAKSKDKSLVPALVRALTEEIDEYDTGDGKIYVRARFVEALGTLRDDRAIEPLTEVLRHSKPVARTAAAKALGRFAKKARPAGPALSAAFSAPNPQDDTEIERLHGAAAIALAKAAPELATTTFAPVLGAPFANVEATESALRGMTRSADPLPLGAPLLELEKELAQRHCKEPSNSEDCWILVRICGLVESELSRRNATHEERDCDSLRR